MILGVPREITHHPCFKKFFEGWCNFDIEDFNYNGADNLLLEIVWGRSDSTCDKNDAYKLNSSKTDFNSVLYGFDDLTFPPDIENITDIRPNIRFFFKYQANFELSDKNKIVVFPNPSTDILKIKSINDINEIRLYNVFGGLILEKEIKNCEAGINVSKINSGVYFLEFNTSKGNISKKIQIIH